jgi:predicted dehydrogenase
MITTEIPARAAGQTDVIGLAVDPIPVVRVGFIGVGSRGAWAVERYTNLEGIEIKAICDMVQANLDRVQNTLAGAGLPKAEEYISADGNAWKKLCERDDIDLVYICTDWENHAPMAVYAMEQGKHAAIEVPAALTLDQCWALVDTAERTRRHCMMLENCCYDFFEMATLNMAQNGVFGDLVHVEGAYIHDLRGSNFTSYYNNWRLKYNAAHTGDPYPTHGLGPVAQILDIHRGDKMNYLVSLSSDQKGMTAYAKERFGADSPEAAREYKLGDMNTTLIYTERGRSMMIQHDVTSPRPYNRLHTVSGTKGFAQKYPVESIALDPNAHSAMSPDELQAFLAKWEHPLTREIGEQARRVGGHGGMDFIMDYRLIYCLQNGLPLDMDVYDAAEWSCIVPLSELSVVNGSAPVEIPDFTRGAWNKVQGFRHAIAD